MWECSAEQVTEITVEHVGIEFTPTATSIERGVLNLKFVLQQMHPALMALTSDEANSRQNPLEAWQRLQTRSDPTAGGRKRKLLRTIIFSSTTLSFGTSSNHRTMESYERTLKGISQGGIQLAGLEALVSVELESHLTLNLKRLRTFELTRLEIATCVEAKIGLIIRGSQQSESGAGGQSDPMHVDAINSLASVKSKRWLVVSSAVETIFKETALLMSHHAKATARKSDRESHGPRVLANERAKKVREMAKVSYKGRCSKTGVSGFAILKSETSQETQELAQTYHTDTSCADNSWLDDVWIHDGWNDDWSLVHEGWVEPYVSSAGSFSLGSFDLGTNKQSKAI